MDKFGIVNKSVRSEQWRIATVGNATNPDGIVRAECAAAT